MADELFIDKEEAAPDVKPPGQDPQRHRLEVMIKGYHLFTLGPVYVGAQLDSDLLDVFYQEEQEPFNAVTIEQPFPMFKNLNEWDFMVQGIERTKDLGDIHAAIVKDRVTERFSQFLMNYQFIRRDTGFYARIYSRPVIVNPPGTAYNVPVEVYMLMSNKGTHKLNGANPYSVDTTPEINPKIREEAEAILGVLGD